MNDLPDELLVKILASSTHAARTAAMLANKTLFRVANSYDDMWTDAEFKRYDDTLVGFFERHLVRNLRLTCTPEDAMKIMESCDLKSVNTLTIRLRYAYEMPFDLSVAIARAGMKLETLELVADNVCTSSSFVVPWLPSLKHVKIIEKSRTPCLDVSFYTWEYPNLETVDIRSRSCTFASRAWKCPLLRDVRLRQTYPDQRANFDGLKLDRLEIDAEESFEVSAKELVVCIDGFGSFRHPFDAEELTFRFASNDCCLSVHNDVIRAAKTVAFEPGIQYTPFVSWHVDVENSPLDVAQKMIVRDPRTTLNFVNVQFKHQP